MFQSIRIKFSDRIGDTGFPSEAQIKQKFSALKIKLREFPHFLGKNVGELWTAGVNIYRAIQGLGVTRTIVAKNEI